MKIGVSGGCVRASYSAPAANIKSLAIRGSSAKDSADNDTIRIVGDLGLPNGITVEGGGGSDEVIYDDSGVVAIAHNYTFGNAPGVWDLRMNRWSAAGDLPAVDAKGISKFTLVGSPGVDTVRVEEVSKLANGLFVNTGAGEDLVHIGAEDGAGMTKVGATVYVDGGADPDKLYYQDANGTAFAHNYTFGASPSNYDVRLNRAAATVAGGLPAPLGGVDSIRVKQYTLNASPGPDNILVELAPAATDGFFINANGGDDTVTVGSAAAGLDNIAPFVTVDGGPGGNDTVVFDNAAGETSDNFIITDSYLTRNGAFPIDYSNFENFHLKAGPGKNNVQQKGAAPGTKYDITFLGGGNHALLADAGLTLSDLAGAGYIAVHGSGVTDTVTYDDEALGVPEHYTLTGTALGVARMPAADFRFDNVGRVEIDAGIGDDQIDLYGVTTKFTVSVAGGAGDDLVLMAAGETKDPTLTDVERLIQQGGKLTLENQPVTVTELFYQDAGTLDLGLGAAGGPPFVTAPSVDLAGILTLYPAVYPTADAYTLVSNTGTDPVTGTFLGLEEGAPIQVGSRWYTISYVGNDGNDVVLTPVDNGLIGDYVWKDANGNGVQQTGEVGFTGITVQLFRGGSLVGTTTTDSLGRYTFTGLGPGTYQVKVLAPSGYTISPQDQGGNDNLDSDFSPATGLTAPVTLAAARQPTSPQASSRRVSGYAARPRLAGRRTQSAA